MHFNRKIVLYTFSGLAVITVVLFGCSFYSYVNAAKREALLEQGLAMHDVNEPPNVDFFYLRKIDPLDLYK